MIVNEMNIFIVEIDSFDSLVKRNFCTGSFGRVEQGDIQLATMHRPDHFGIVFAVAL